MKKLYIGNCSFQLNNESLQSFIESKGVNVTEVNIITDRDTGRSRGFAFATLDDSQDVNQAIEALNGQESDGRALTVNEARERAPRSSGGFGGGDRDRGGFGGGGGGDRGGSRGGRDSRRGGGGDRGGNRGGSGGGGKRGW